MIAKLLVPTPVPGLATIALDLHSQILEVRGFYARQAVVCPDEDYQPYS
jgi:hypothetical protein